MGGYIYKGEHTMPKKRNKPATIDVTGLSIKDIMNIDLDTFNNLNERDLRRITSRLVSAGNKRIRALQKHNIESPALQSLGTDNVFSTKLPESVSKEQRVNKLRQEFASVRNFLTMKTSTIKGWKQYQTALKKELSASTGLSMKDIESINISRAYNLLHKMQQSGQIPMGADEISKLQSKHARDYIFAQMYENPDMSDKDIMKATNEDFTEFYETKEIEL